MALLTIVLVLIFLLLLGSPVIFSIAIAGISYFFVKPGMMDMVAIMPHRFFEGMNSFVFLCIPLFVLTGEMMNKSGMMLDLVKFVQIFVGRLRGGMAYVNIFASMLFGGITGSALADVSALGPLEIKAMKEDGYPVAFAAALTATSSVQGPIIPPSIPMVIYASLTNASVGALFLGGIIPGIMIGLGQSLVVFLIAKKRNFPKHEMRMTLREKLAVVRVASLALFMPIIILGGILLGIFTPTEAAAVAAVYAAIISVLYYRSVKFTDVRDILLNTGKTTASIYLIVAFATIVSWEMASEHLPQLVNSFVRDNNLSVVTLLFLINIFLLFNGCWLSDIAQLILFAPIFMPILESMGIHPVHFGVVMVVNVMLGLITPPYGCALFLAAILSGSKLKDIVIETLPFTAVSVTVLFVVTYFPGLVLWIPKMAGLI
ncbi:permease [Deltaproteobacteria bacterium]|nr:permease [Deltaproteobacteria bacterium]